MGLLRLIFGLLAALLFSAFGAVAMPMVPTAAHQVEFPPHQKAAIAEHTSAHFEARAPPMAAANVAFTGVAVAEQGDGIIVHGYEIHVASLGVGGEFDATNTTVRPGLLPTDLSRALRGYGDDIHQITGYRIRSDQVSNLRRALQETDYSQPLSRAAHDAHRRAFNNNRSRLIREWEANTGQTWPTYGSNPPNGRQAGGKWDAHELIPNQNGGPIEWWNISPARFPDQHQGAIHGRNGAFNRLMDQIGN